MGRKGKAMPMAPRQTQLHLGSSWRLDAALILGKERARAAHLRRRGQSADRRRTAESVLGRLSSATSPTRDTRKHKWQQQHRARSKRNNFHGG